MHTHEHGNIPCSRCSVDPDNWKIAKKKLKTVILEKSIFSIQKTLCAVGCFYISIKIFVVYDLNLKTYTFQLCINLKPPEYLKRPHFRHFFFSKLIKTFNFSITSDKAYLYLFESVIVRNNQNDANLTKIIILKCL